MDPSGLEESPTWSGTKAFFWHFLAVGPYNLGAGAYGGIREVVYYTRDVVAVSADAVSTSVGYPLRVKEWSQCGLNNSPYHDRFWQNAAINAGRSGLGGLTVGASEVGIGVYDYTQTGDGAALQQHMGGVAAGNAPAYASIRFGGRRTPDTPRIPLIRAPRGLVPRGTASRGTPLRVTGVQANKIAGDATADAIAIREAGIREGCFNTVGGPRRIDVLTLGDDVLAIESKVGRTALDSHVRQELARDWWLRRQGQVDRVRWEFSPNEAGKFGPTGPLLQKLQKLEFEVRINTSNPTTH